jgi:hypothetical protein
MLAARMLRPLSSIREECPLMCSRYKALLVALLTLAPLVGFVTTAPAAASAAQSQLHVVMAVNRFAVGPRANTAYGTVTANLTDQSGHTTVVRAPIALTAARGRTCQILNLDLRQLNLVLLGLNVHLDRVHLTITGKPGGGVLGSLFCRLARARVAAARAAIARTMNASLRRHPLKPLSFTVPLQPRSAHAAAVTCPVLDLILGPLNLNLLGLVVDLNQVHLTITATQGGGALGDLFCSLSH